MTQVRARYYDGKTSQQREVLVRLEPWGRLSVSGEGVDFSCALSEVRPSPRVGNTRRHLRFADGSLCETEDNDAVDRIFAGLPSQAPGRLIHLWESKLGYAALALALTAAALWAGITYGIPALAKQVAFSLPPSTEKALGRDALAGLDRILLSPTQLPAARREELRALFSVVVVTDQLVQLASDDNEIAAVLAHEIGHLRYRHALRRLLQDSATVLLVAAVTGDLTSVASLASALPAMLLQAKYSRDFEREADEFALDTMKRHGIPAGSFAAILLRIEQRRGASTDVPDYLSTHPATRERAAR